MEHRTQVQEMGGRLVPRFLKGVIGYTDDGGNPYPWTPTTPFDPKNKTPNMRLFYDTEDDREEFFAVIRKYNAASDKRRVIPARWDIYAAGQKAQQGTVPDMERAEPVAPTDTGRVAAPPAPPVPPAPTPKRK